MTSATFTVLMNLAACVGCASKPPDRTAKENCFIGSATMREDASILMMLRAEGPGGMIGDSVLVSEPDDPNYAEILRHVGPIKPGESKLMPCWPES